LLLDLFLNLCELVLKGLHYLLSDTLLFLELCLATLALTPPIFILLRHAVNVVRNKIDAFAERIGGLAQNLDCLFHELDIILSESALMRAP
jgi:hypothetical protein